MDNITAMTYNSHMIYFIVIGSGLGAMVLAVTIVLLVGIDIRMAVNIDNNFALIDMFILRGIFLFKAKLILHKGEFYLKIGGGVYRRLSYFMQGDKPGKPKGKMPTIKLHNVDIRLCVGTDSNAALETVMLGLAGITLDNLRAIAHDKVRIKGYRQSISPNYTDDVAKLAVDMTIKWSLVKLVRYIANTEDVEDVRRKM